MEGLFLDECLASLRHSGGYIGAHSGEWQGALRGRYLYDNGRFRCGQINVLLAVTGIGPGDGATLVIPGSHMSNLEHPKIRQHPPFGNKEPVQEIEGLVEVRLDAGDALFFVDGLTHGATSRTNPGERRAVIHRYGPAWGATAYGCENSPALLERLTPERRRILQPIAPRRPP